MIVSPMRNPIKIPIANPLRHFRVDSGIPEWMKLGWNLFQSDPIVGPEPVFSVASPNYDESGNNIGNAQRVDAGKGLWMGGQVADLYLGASSLCRSLTPSINADNSITYTVNLIETNCFARNNSASSSQRSVKLIVSGNVPYIYVRTASDAWATINLSNASVVNTDPVTYITARLLGGGKVEITLTTTLSTLSSVYAMNQFGPSRVSGGILEQSNASGVQIGDYITIHSGVITSTPYPMPYVPPGATQLANAATTGGNGTNIPLDAGLTAAYSGQNSFLDRFYFGFSSAQVSADTALRSVRNVTSDVLYVSSGGVIKSSDGTNTATVTVTGGWSAGQTISLYRRTTGTQMQVGYRKSGETAITWGSLVAYDGSDNPGTHERCCLNGTLPVWGQAKGTANKYCSDSELLEMEALAA